MDENGMPRHSSRISFGRFEDIARVNLQYALECEEELCTLREKREGLTGLDRDHFTYVEMAAVENKRDSSCVIAIVFAALTVESYIYDYGAKNLSDTFVESHLDRLSVVNKWIKIPMLVTGKPFPKEGRAFYLLIQLVKNRNYLVHMKSAPVAVWDEKRGDWVASAGAKRMIEFEQAIFKYAQQAIEALDELKLVMRSLDPRNW